MTAFDNQTDTTLDLWASTNYPLCTKFGLRITPGTVTDNGTTPSAIPHEALAERLKATGKWGDWLNWTAGGITAGANGVYPVDVESFLSGIPNYD